MAAHIRPLLVISHALHARNWEQSGLLVRLEDAGIRVTIAAPASLRVGSGWNDIALEPWIARGISAKVLEALRLGMLVAGTRRGGLNYQAKVRAKRRPLAALEMRGWRAIGSVADPLPFIRRLGRMVPAGPRLPAGHTSLILPTLIHEDVAQAGIVRAARREGLPILAVPASWDNLVTKGFFLEQPDRIAVWGAASAMHAVDEQGFAPDRVTITGPPHFWPYAPTAAVVPFRCPGLRHVVFAGTTVNYSADEAQILVELGQRISEDPHLKDVVIVYRPHPRAKTEDVEQLRARKPVRIVFDPTWRNGWSGSVTWIRSLTEAALCTVSAFSTVVVEAALLGVPSILVGFGDSAHGTGKAIDHAKYEHMIEVANQVGVKIAPHMADVMDLIRATARGDRPKAERIRHWAQRIASTDEDPRQRLVSWITKHG